MLIIRTIRELVDFVDSKRKDGAKIGLVPTMGALHAGHCSLMQKAVKDNDVVVASLFVNPVQFNNPVDLETYPRKEEEDFKILEKEGVSAVFAPTVEEVYPEGMEAAKREFDLGGVAEVMEGKMRPGHFQGVALIVNRLFEIVKPDRAYFGEKDFQQIAVINRMVQTEGLNIEIVRCPIFRADDGLAMSSRNALLSKEEREVAPEIYRMLSYSKEYARNHSVQATRDTVVEALNSTEHLEVEYFEIVDGRTLEPVKDWSDSDWIVGCITVYCGKVRLIDNITYK